MSPKLDVLIVDDSRSYQFLLSRALEQTGKAHIVGKASDGNMALRMAGLYKPDVITLDVEMPVMDGLETLKKLKEQHAGINVIMVSALTIRGAEVTLKALEAGAFDFLGKPSLDTSEANHLELVNQLTPILQSLLRKKTVSQGLTPIRTPEKKEEKRVSLVAPVSNVPVSVIGLGISTGGPNALRELLPQFPQNFKIPILIVQHMPPMFTKALADSLNQKCSLEVKEAAHGETVRPGCVYIAPGGKQMKVEKQGLLLTIEITDDPPEKNCRPSVDYLFRSLAKTCEGSAMGVIMTGMGNDGTLGLKLMKRHGSPVIAQDEASCVVFGMPMEAIKAGVADQVLPLSQIAVGIQKMIQNKNR